MSIPNFPNEMYIDGTVKGYGTGISPIQMDQKAWEKLYPDIVQRKPYFVANDGEKIDIDFPRRTVLFADTVNNAKLSLGKVPGDFFELQNNTSHDINILVDTSVAGQTNTFLLSAGNTGNIRFNGTDWEYTAYNIFTLKEYLDTAIENIGDVAGDQTDIAEAISDATELLEAADEDISDLQTSMSTANQNITNLQGAITSLGNSLPSIQQDITDIESDLGAIETDIAAVESDIASIQQTISDIENGTGSGSGGGNSGGNNWGDISIAVYSDGNDPVYREASARNLKDVLGVSTVAEVFAKLRERCNGTDIPDFSNLRIGDYIDLDNLNDGDGNIAWNATYKNLRILIAGFNTYHNSGDTQNTKNHIMMMFRNCYRQKRMHSSNSNAGGFPSSELYTFLHGTFKTGLITAMGGTDYIYPVRLCRSIKSNYAWTTYSVWVPSEIEVFGTPYWGDEGTYLEADAATSSAARVGYITNVQFPIFAYSYEYRIKYLNNSRAWWWESTPPGRNATAYCSVDYTGGAGDLNASNTSGGVSPCFAIA